MRISKTVLAGTILVLMCGSLLVLATVLLTGCTNTSPNGTVGTNWKVHGTIAYDGSRNRVDVYVEIYKDNVAFISALVFVDDQKINSVGDGTYFGFFDPDSLSSPSLLKISTPVDQFQFQQQVQVPSPFTFEANGLTNNQVFSNTMVNLQWTPAFGVGAQGEYMLLAKQTSGSMTALGYQQLLTGAEGTIPTDAFRSLNGDFQTGTYSLWVVAVSQQPISYGGFSTTFADSVFTENIDRIGVTGKIGALYIPSPLQVTAVASTQP
jgi:hypothetical protein